MRCPCRQGIRSGTTALTLLLRGDNGYLAWAGDSSAMLCMRDGTVTMLTEPHKPDRPDERQRIEGVGGHVMAFFGVWRVAGVLAVSRAIGDRPLKPSVSAEPDIRHIKLDSSVDFILLACDGLWDVMDASSAAAFVRECRSAFDGTDVRGPGGIAGVLAKRALSLGSLDNITIIIIFNPAGAAAMRSPGSSDDAMAVA